MNAQRKQRLTLVMMIVFGSALAVTLVAFALSQNINLFYSPSQISMGEAPPDTRIRAGGMVVEGSIRRDPDSLRVEFDITDYAHSTTVEYVGILPDLFREGQGIVAQGTIDEQGRMMASEVLAKHDENYMPAEIAEALAAAGELPEMPASAGKGY